jgi:hypothetical protein
MFGGAGIRTDRNDFGGSHGIEFDKIDGQQITIHAPTAMPATPTS